MVIIPIYKKLKKRIHKTIALAQDILIMEIYNDFPKAVIHGGTAIWRCYGSNRFSEDVDIYLPILTGKKEIENFLEGLKNKGFRIEKFKRTNKTIFSKFSYLSAIISAEVILKNIKNFVTKRYEMSDGTFILINTLTPEDIICGKVLTYLKRRKIRDLYDIFFLLEFVEDREKIRSSLQKLLKEFKSPIDENELKVLIISGSVPTTNNILEKVRKWAK